MTTSGEDPRDRYGGPPDHGPPPGYGQTPGYGPPYGHHPAVPTADERNWAMAAHAGSFLAAWAALGLLAPLIVLLAKGDESAFVRRHAVESLNFQINALVYTLVFFMLAFLLIGIPLLLAYAIFYAIYVIMGTVRSSNGEEHRYPLTIRFVS